MFSFLCSLFGPFFAFRISDIGCGLVRKGEAAVRKGEAHGEKRGGSGEKRGGRDCGGFRHGGELFLLHTVREREVTVRNFVPISTVLT
jgi:hypothetical protein